MIVRDIQGKINIVSRKTCKNDSVYYDKLYNIRLQYTAKYKNILVINNNCYNKNPKDKLKLNHLSDD